MPGDVQYREQFLQLTWGRWQHLMKNLDKKSIILLATLLAVAVIIIVFSQNILDKTGRNIGNDNRWNNRRISRRAFVGSNNCGNNCCRNIGRTERAWDICGNRNYKANCLWFFWTWQCLSVYFRRQQIFANKQSRRRSVFRQYKRCKNRRWYTGK